jgi:hypothetical protein
MCPFFKVTMIKRSGAFHNKYNREDEARSDPLLARKWKRED